MLYSQGLFTTPVEAFGASFTELTSSFVTVDGNLNLAGKVTVLTPRGEFSGRGLRTPPKV